jgi:hypothetical protein
MTVKLVFDVVTAVALVAITAFELVQLTRRRDDLPLRFMVMGVGCLAFVVTTGLPVAPFEPLHDFLGTFAFSNIAWMFMAYCFSAFFLLADHTRPLAVRRRRAALGFAVLVLAVTGMILVQKTAPPGTWHSPRIPADYRTWRNIAYYLLVDGYALVVWTIGALRALRYLRQIEHAWARAALVLVMVGTAGMAIGVDGVGLVRQALYIAFPGSKWPYLRTVYNVGRLGGQILLALGLALAPLATQAVRLREWQDRRLRSRSLLRIAPLWLLLTQEFPHVILRKDGAGSGSSAWRSRSYDRAAAEVADGLARLAPYCDPASDGRSAADQVENALARRAAGPPGRAPFPRIEPDFGCWQDRARWMADLSRELERRGVAERVGEGDRGVVRAS